MNPMETVQQKLARLAKWKLHRFYLKYPRIARYLPPTALLTPETLDRFLRLYKVVYIKASTVHTGKGIIKAWKADNGYKFVIVRGEIRHATSAHDLYRRIHNMYPQRSFIVQKAIDLSKLNGRDFDIRVMMMRDGERKWNYAGMVVKVTGPGSVVSNVRRGGGYVTTVEHAIRRSLHCSTQQVRNIKKELIQLSRNIMQASEQYPFFSFQCGLDLAVDRKGRVWVIEVNLHNPSHGLFNKLNDKTFFRRIGRLYSSYRRKHKRII
ncbi:YheC/YheD family protein [Paenibacillus cremeus]|uniref:YheC/YheD family protein n=1 Tax=Paenibacillus cremeus TaxID=2163881 RepID=A0A559K4L5_9BACL|nr:YheC/YheD family protein [Paenibacillus cremeus]TVY07040.1 YheC/YheD family protein [Paenibacillus cremeus]